MSQALLPAGFSHRLPAREIFWTISIDTFRRYILSEQIRFRIREEDYIRELLNPDFNDAKRRKIFRGMKKRIEDLMDELALPHEQLPLKHDVSPNQRRQLLSLLLASEAESLDAETEITVHSFRQQHLPNGLLSRYEVDQWMAEHGKKDGPSTQWLEIPLSEGQRPRRPAGSG